MVERFITIADSSFAGESSGEPRYNKIEGLARKAVLTKIKAIYKSFCLCAVVAKCIIYSVGNKGE